MTRFLCIHLPAWPLQRLARDRPTLRDEAVVVVDPRAQRGPRVLLASKKARRIGVRPHMPLAEALSIDPHLSVHDRDPEAERRMLERLALWAERFGPAVSIDGEDSLIVDVAGCGRYFRGEDRLLSRAWHDLGAGGWFARVAIADTPGTAWALARFGRRATLVHDTEASLRSLPLAALRLPASAETSLRQLGVARVAQLLDLPRAGVATRFGTDVLRRIDQVLGFAPETLTPCRALPEMEAGEAFEPPTERRDDLYAMLDHLVEHVQEMLHDRHRGARRVECWIYGEGRVPSPLSPQGRGAGGEGASDVEPSESDMQCHDTSTTPHPFPLPQGARGPTVPSERQQSRNLRNTDISANARNRPSPRGRGAGGEGVSDVEASEHNHASRDAHTFHTEVELLRPSRSAQQIRDLLHLRLNPIRFTQPIIAVRLRVTLAEPLIDRQQSFLEDDDLERLTPLIDALSNRLGRSAVARAVLQFDPQPEHACRFEPMMATASSGDDTASPHRPIQLWREPEQVEAMSLVPDGPPLSFRWHGILYRVLHAWGPERIDAGWWRGQDVERDYYAVATKQGPRFWLFRRRQDGMWFIHGCFD